MKGRYDHLDGLRAIAVGLVVVAHAGYQNWVPGGSGVTIFFTISGFIISLLLLREVDKTRQFNVKGFYFRRSMKLLPPLAVIIVIPSIVAIVTHGQVSPLALLAQILFVFNWYNLSGGGGELPGSGIVWSLAVEEQFYIAIGILWYVLVQRRRAGPRSMLAVGIVILVSSDLWRAWLAYQGASSLRIYQGTDTRASSIAIGIIGAALLVGWERKNVQRILPNVIGGRIAFASMMLILAASLLFREEWFRDTLRYSLQSLVALYFILVGFLSTSRVARGIVCVLSMRWLSFIGRASYSIYLVDKPLYFALGGATGPLHGHGSIVGTLVAVGIPIGVGATVYLLVEVPIRENRPYIRNLVYSLLRGKCGSRSSE